MQPGHHHVARGFGACRGQAIIESCLVIIFLCVLFLGLFQLMHAFVSREILYHAAACAARAKTVGLNYWMVQKTMRVAAIPNAGTLTEPVISQVDPVLVSALATMNPGALWDMALVNSPRSPIVSTELTRIPDYLTNEGETSAQNILDYSDWNTITCGQSMMLNSGNAGTLTVQVQQPHELLLSLEWVLTGDLQFSAHSITNITLSRSYTIEAHYPLYLDDHAW